MSLSATPYYPPHSPPIADAMGYLRRSFTFMRNPLQGFQSRVYQEGVSQHRSLLTRMHVITSPDAISETLVKRAKHYRKSRLNQRIIEPVTKEGLITTHGPQWKRQRRALAPLFRHRHMEDLSHHVMPSIQSFVSKQSKLDSQILDLKSAMSDLTFDIFARAFLGNPQGFEADKLRAASDKAISAAGTLRVDDFLPLPNWFPRILTPSTYAAIACMRDAGTRLLAERHEADAADDLVGLLSQAGQVEDHPLSLQEQVDNLIGFFIAGHESTAVSLTWAFYMIARHGDTQSRIREEIQSLELEPGEWVSYEHLKQLPFTTAVFNETMRLYPSIPIIGREAICDTTIAGQKVAKGETVIIPIYVMHRSEQYWDQPLQFDPDRFIRNPDLAKRNPKFMPFGAGHRVCIGAAFAMLEAVLAIANIVNCFSLRDVSKLEPNPEISVSLRPSETIELQLSPL